MTQNWHLYPGSCASWNPSPRLSMALSKNKIRNMHEEDERENRKVSKSQKVKWDKKGADAEDPFVTNAVELMRGLELEFKGPHQQKTTSNADLQKMQGGDFPRRRDWGLKQKIINKSRYGNRVDFSKSEDEKLAKGVYKGHQNQAQAHEFYRINWNRRNKRKKYNWRGDKGPNDQTKAERDKDRMKDRKKHGGKCCPKSYHCGCFYKK